MGSVDDSDDSDLDDVHNYEDDHHDEDNGHNDHHHHDHGHNDDHIEHHGSRNFCRWEYILFLHVGIFQAGIYVFCR